MRKKSFTDQILCSQRALVIGHGGGGDVILTLPIARHLKRLGVDEVFIGGVSCQWWTPVGSPVVDRRGTAIIGPHVYSVEDLSNAEIVSPAIALARPDTNLNGRRPAEAVISEIVDFPVIILGLTRGSVGIVESIEQFMEAYEIDVLISIDVGSDSFYNGDQVRPAQSALVDFLVLSALLQIRRPVMFGLAGYGLDGELALEELEENVALVMRHNGFLGAYGLEPDDVTLMLKACEAYPDPIEYLIPRAALGEFGLRRIRTASPWGTIIRVTPLAAMILFFDPAVVVEHASKGAASLMQTSSLSEAESLYFDTLGQLPESRLVKFVDYLEPNVSTPDKLGNGIITREV